MKNNILVTIDVTNIIETFFNKYLVIKNNVIKPSFIMSMMLSVSKELDFPEYVVYEQLESVLEYPDQLTNNEKLNKYITELFDISNAQPLFMQEIKKRVHVSYMNFLNSQLSQENEQELLNVIFNGVNMDYYDFKEVGGSYFILLEIKNE